MATNFNDAPTDPDVTPPYIPPREQTIPWDPNMAGGRTAQTFPDSPTISYPTPYAPPAAPNSPPAPSAPAPRQWPGSTDQNAPTVVNPQLAPVAPQAPARAPAPRTPPAAPAPAPRRPAPARPAPYSPKRGASTLSAPVHRLWRLLPLPHALLGLGFLLLLAALNIPWGATSGGTLVYAQSFPIPFFSGQPDAAGQLAQLIVTAVAIFSLTLAGMNYVLTFLNWLSRPIGMAGCATALLMPLMLIMMLLLLIVDGGALVFGAFDPLAGAALAPWQAGFTLLGAHAELGYYAWYTGVILNTAGMFTQPFVRR